MAKSAGKNIIEKVTALALPVCAEQGVILWDVEFKKEGSDWFLRFFIDKEGGVGIEDCERFSRAIDPVLDEADPIDQGYILEVSTPGIERVLKKPEHFQAYIGADVEMKLFQAVEGHKVFSGRLEAFAQGEITLSFESGKTISALPEDAAYIRLKFAP